MTVFSHLSYLEKNRYVSQIIDCPPHQHLKMILVIPTQSLNYLEKTLSSLSQCNPVSSAIEILPIIHPDLYRGNKSLKNVKQELNKLEISWKRSDSNIAIYPLLIKQLMNESVSAGLLRKLGMDEATDRFEQIENPKGFIINLDEGSEVESDFWEKLEIHFRKNRKTRACSLYFEYPLMDAGNHSILHKALLRYELYLRYYIQGLRFAGYPRAQQVHSPAFAVRCDAYQQQGGMNKKVVDEVFYFLHKYSAENQLSELNSSRIIPDISKSDSASLGSTRSLSKWISQGGETEFTVINPLVFEILKDFFEQVPSLYTETPKKLHPILEAYWHEISGNDKLLAIRKHVSNQNNFIKRFFHWWSPLCLLQFFHFCQKRGIEEIDIKSAASKIWLMSALPATPDSLQDLLIAFRQLHKQA